MPVANTQQTFGTPARVLHWLTALLILSAIPLGLIANDLPYDTSESLAQKAQLFSLHKTIGVAAFTVAALRIMWALTQPRPAPLHPDRKLETAFAEAVHWLLYISLLAVPLSGWIHHAATAGFAPILWPFGQDLPGIPESESLANTAAAAHWVFTKLLIASIVLHITGALKHHVIDRDATLRRMLRGAPASQTPPRGNSSLTPLLVAIGLYSVGAGLAMSLTTPPPAIRAETETAPVIRAMQGGNWQVQNGTLEFSVRQLGSEVTGGFADWTADIIFSETPTDGRHGQVAVAIDTTSISLASVTPQVKSADFLDTATFGTAQFTADILTAATGYTAYGTLTLHGITRPVTLPFTLILDGDTARMSGTATLDRRDFGIGPAYKDEATVGFGVTVTIALTATRSR
ncbi:MAG: cytochrome b/b6 domain-containing protein [Paracoccaceae bacterium]|nr:cytochrome b/b6 domain-containing protein [Paracoccaceae bacterium]